MQWTTIRDKKLWIPNRSLTNGSIWTMECLFCPMWYWYYDKNANMYQWRTMQYPMWSSSIRDTILWNTYCGSPVLSFRSVERMFCPMWQWNHDTNTTMYQRTLQWTMHGSCIRNKILWNTKNSITIRTIWSMEFLFCQMWTWNPDSITKLSEWRTV